MAKITKDDVLSYLENSNMLEISELIKDIEERLILLSSQKNQIPPLLAKLLLIRN